MRFTFNRAFMFSSSLLKEEERLHTSLPVFVQWRFTLERIPGVNSPQVTRTSTSESA